jgi:uncharacterized protein YjbI with pentapeptide repeats
VPQCKYHYTCGRDVEDNSAEGLCILHSTDSAKDTHRFAEALVTHREQNGNNFQHFVFPEAPHFLDDIFTKAVDFSGATFSDGISFAFFHRRTFSERLIFQDATFSPWIYFGGVTFSKEVRFARATFTGDRGLHGGANFVEATFKEEVTFDNATFDTWVFFGNVTFSGKTTFARATFNERADFERATFNAEANFANTTFNKPANFAGAKFNAGANFTNATFNAGVDFSWATFSGAVTFAEATFLGRTLFARPQGVWVPGYIFAAAEIDFTHVVMGSPDAVTFLCADLTKCQFQDTDLRKVQLVGVKWPQNGRRVCIYDEEIASAYSKQGGTPAWSQVERLYRELKQNYEDRRDYERAGDFHYGEKEMRRRNPETPMGLRFFLTLYRVFSGYGERYLPPLRWAGLLFIGSTIGYMWWGLRLKDGSLSLTWTYPWVNLWDWLQAAHYSFRVMTLLKPDDWVPLRYGQLVNTLQTLLGPTFLGLFALALRQRLKR